jgi:GNAT superfamily N-acetyltransferase
MRHFVPDAVLNRPSRKRRRADVPSIDGVADALAAIEAQQPELAGVQHEFRMGNPAPPFELRGSTGRMHRYRGCVPSRPISGSLLLDEVDGAHLDYEIILNILAEPHGGLPQRDNEPKVAIVMCIFETYVPRAHRGRGIGAQLARAAFAIAAVRGWLVWPKCSYISESFLGVDPEPTSADGKPLAALVVTPNQSGSPHMVLDAAADFNAALDGNDPIVRR